ncbi:ABC transporter substrate-binding protein [Bacteroidota bacterium]
MKNTKIAILGLVLLLVALAGCSSHSNITGKAVYTTDSDVSVRLPIPIIEAAFTPFYSAIDEGFYSSENLDVKFNLGSPEANPVKMVLSGADDFGVLGGPDTLLVARSRGEPLVAIAVIHKDSNFPVLISLKESGIETVNDLQDKKVGFFYGHISTDVIRNLFNKQKVNVEEVNVGFNYNPLIAGQIDAEWAFRTTAGVNLPAQGIEINTISPKDYGITTHGFTIFTTEEMIENNPEVVEQFLRATLKGVEYTLNSPDTALDSVISRNDKANPDLERQRLALYAQVTSNSEEFPPGYLDYKMFEETYERLNEEGVLESDFDINSAFTTEFIEKIYG